MNAAKFGQGLGCLAILGILGAIAALYVLVKAIIWAVEHIRFM